MKAKLSIIYLTISILVTVIIYCQHQFENKENTTLAVIENICK